MCNLHQVEYAREFAERIVGMSRGKVVFEGTVADLTEDILHRIYYRDPDAKDDKEHELRHLRERGRECPAAGAAACGDSAISGARPGAPSRSRRYGIRRSQIELSPVALVSGAGYMWDFFTRMFPPDLSYLAVLGGRDGRDGADRHLGHVARDHPVDPARVSRRAQHEPAHRGVPSHALFLLNALRAINELVFALIFVTRSGSGPFAGVLAIALHATGMLAKFCAEEIEGVDRGQVEAQQATGAARMQVILFGIVPQVVPAIHRLRDLSPRRQHPRGHRARPGRAQAALASRSLRP